MRKVLLGNSACVLLVAINICLGQILPVPYLHLKKNTNKKDVSIDSTYQVVKSEIVKDSSFQKTTLKSVKYNSLEIVKLEGIKNNNIRKLSLHYNGWDGFSKKLIAINQYYNSEISKIKNQRDSLIDTLRKRARVEGNLLINLKIDSIRTACNDSINKYNQLKFNEYKIEYDTYDDGQCMILPTRMNSILAKCYYNINSDKVVEGLQNGLWQYNPSSSGNSLYFEGVAGYAWGLRISLGAMIASTQLIKIDTGVIKTSTLSQIDSLVKVTDSANKANNSIQRLLAGGGNLMAVISYPWIVIHINDNKTSNISSTLFNKLGLNIPSLGNEIKGDSVALLNTLGGQVDGNLSLDYSTFSFGVFSDYSLGWLWDKSLISSQHNFCYQEVIAGFYITHFKIYAKFQWINNAEIQKGLNWVIGVGLTPWN